MTLKEALNYKKISQTELAKMLKVQPQQVFLWVNGKYSPRTETQRKIDELLGCKVTYK